MDSDESEGKDWSDLEREAAEDDDEDEDEGMVFCYQNCSDLLWEKNVLVIDCLRSLEQFIQTVKG